MLKILFYFFPVIFISNINAQGFQQYAQIDTFNTSCSTSVVIDVLANDSIPSFRGTPLIIGSELNWGGSYYCDTCQSKQGGIFTLIGDTIIDYTAPNNYYGWDEIIYLLTDSSIGLRNHYDSARVAIFVDSCNSVSISEVSFHDAFQLFPNPSNSKTNIIFKQASKQSQLKVYDLSGAIVFNKNNITDRNIQLDLLEYSKGIYILEVKQGNEYFRKKLIVN